MTSEQFIQLMSRDKKALGGKIRLVLLKSIGEAVISGDYDKQILIDTLEQHHDTASWTQLGL